MPSPEEWQVLLDERFPEGVRVEVMPDGVPTDDENYVYFCYRVIVEDEVAGFPQMRVTDMARGNGEHWFVATSYTPSQDSVIFEVTRGGAVLMTAHIPPEVKPFMDELRDWNLPEYQDFPASVEETA